MSGDPIEEPFFFELGGDCLFGFLHRAIAKSRAAIVICHALAEEKLWSHRVYVNFAREMARLGFTVLRFDMRGEGDSDLDFEHTTVETRVADVLCAVDVLRKKEPDVPGVFLVGHRFGGTVAAVAAARDGDSIRGVAVWDPIPDAEEYFGQLLRTNLATQMATQGKVTRSREELIHEILGGATVVVDGYGLTAPLFKEMAVLKWPQRPDLLREAALVIEVSNSPQPTPNPTLAALAVERPRLRLATATEPPFWRETRQFHRRAAVFTELTLTWLAEQCR